MTTQNEISDTDDLTNEVQYNKLLQYTQRIVSCKRGAYYRIPDRNAQDEMKYKMNKSSRENTKKKPIKPVRNSSHFNNQTINLIKNRSLRRHPHRDTHGVLIFLIFSNRISHINQNYGHRAAKPHKNHRYEN